MSFGALINVVGISLCTYQIIRYHSEIFPPLNFESVNVYARHNKYTVADVSEEETGMMTKRRIDKDNTETMKKDKHETKKEKDKQRTKKEKDESKKEKEKHEMKKEKEKHEKEKRIAKEQYQNVDQKTNKRTEKTIATQSALSHSTLAPTKKATVVPNLTLPAKVESTLGQKEVKQVLSLPTMEPLTASATAPPGN